MTESTDELETQPVSEPQSEEVGQSATESWGESATHLQDESASDLHSDSWNDLPDTIASALSISVRRSAFRSGSGTERRANNSEAGCGDAGSDVITLALSDAKSDEQSTNRRFQASDARSVVTSIEMSDGRSDEVSLQVSVLRCLPANSETCLLTSFQGSFRGILDCRLSIVD